MPEERLIHLAVRLCDIARAARGRRLGPLGNTQSVRSRGLPSYYRRGSWINQ